VSVVDGDDAATVASLAVAPPDVGAVAHRIVHGGSRFREPVLVDDEVVEALDGLTELAPLHMRPAIEALREARSRLPDLPHVAVFDTAFHATIPPVAREYPLPRRAREDWGVRRYGFHGLSVQWASEQIRVQRLVVCHLGGGCSVTAVRNGRSIDTTMGFTPLEGVPMATRPGSVDPGALVYLLRHHLSVDELDALLEHDSGLLGLSGVSGDVRELEASHEPSARLALDVFAYRVAAAVASMAAALGGLDALVFTAGIGEHSQLVRDAICARLGFLGVGGEGRVRVVVVEAREDLVAAREALTLL
jgi:acetate kinase